MHIRSHRRAPAILEIGLGTGLNCVLTAAYRDGISLRYTALEPDPLPDEVLTQLDYGKTLSASSIRLFRALHKGPWEEGFELEPGMIVTKHRQSVQTFYSPQPYDLVYFDAFSPAVQPDMWTESVFAGIFHCCAPEAVLVTYSSRGSVRRALAAAGFLVEKLPGPPGKHEIVRASKPVGGP